MLVEKFRNETFIYSSMHLSQTPTDLNFVLLLLLIFCVCGRMCLCLINHKIFIQVENICPKYTALTLSVIRKTPNSILNQNAVLKIIFNIVCIQH